MAVVREKNLYTPGAGEPFKLSRSRLENFVRCARCFYLDRRLGVDHPSMPGFTLNSAVDTLLKKEFDLLRAKKEAHVLMREYGLQAIPLAHANMDTWRHNFSGVQYFHEPTNFLIFGAVDDIWVTPGEELIVVDYKATSKDGDVSLDDAWKEGYKRQMEIYQWLLRQNGFRVAKTGYFVYANGRKDLDKFDGRLEFKVQLLPYDGDDSWVEPTIIKAHTCLNQDQLPLPDPTCEYCQYFAARAHQEEIREV